MVFPGVAGYEEIQANHSLVLRQQTGRIVREPRCEPGVLAGNPVAEEIALAAGKRLPDMVLCTVEGSDGGMAWAAAGPPREAYESAVGQARLWFETSGRAAA